MKQGEFKLTLGEDELLLRCTPHALRTVLTKHGGIRAVMQKLYLVEFDIMFDLIASGLGETKFDKNNLEENIFLAGIINLVEQLTEFVDLLGNGGKPSVKSEDKEPGNL
jgi:hypothetical protein